MILNTSTKLKPIKNAESKSITKDEMWSSLNKSLNIKGVDGYNPVNSYFDHKQNKLERELFQLNMAVWARKAKYPPPILPKDKEGNPIIPIKKTFIDFEVLRAKSYFSPEKAEKYKESKGLEAYVKKPNDKARIYSFDRETYIHKIYRKHEFENKLNEDQSLRAEKVKEKQADLLKTKKHWVEILKEKYKGKSVFSKGVRTGIMSDAEFIGEKLPFYNSFVKKGDEPDKNTMEFYPNFNFVRRHSPTVKFNKQMVLNTEPLERRDQLLEEKADKVKTKWEDRKIVFSGLKNENLNKIDQKGRVFFSYRKVFNCFFNILLSIYINTFSIKFIFFFL